MKPYRMHQLGSDASLRAAFRAAISMMPIMLLATVALPQSRSFAQGMPGQPPIAMDDYGFTDSRTSITIDVLANDSGITASIDPTSVTILEPTSTGTTTVDPVTGEIEFTPDPGIEVNDLLIYEVSDENGDVSNPAFVWISVDHVPPGANSDTDATSYTESVTIDVLVNDSFGTAPIDPESVSIVTAAANGSTAVDAVTGAVTYTPDALFSGSDWFEYVVADIDGVGSNAARVDVVVTNDPPSIVWFDAWPEGYGVWVFEGQVTDERPETVTIEFGGVISGSTTVDAFGYFVMPVQSPPAGPASATATDELGLESEPEGTSIFK